jgi:hypothetical protein
MRWHIAIIRAIAVVAALLLAGGCALMLEAAFHFKGTCAGLMPFLSAPQPCKLSEYVWDSTSFSIEVLLSEFWRWLLFAAIMVLAVSIAVERRRLPGNAA